MLVSCAPMAAALLILRRLLSDFGTSGHLGAIVSMTLFVGVGALTYFGVMLIDGRDILLGLVNDFRGRRRGTRR